MRYRCLSQEIVRRVEWSVERSANEGVFFFQFFFVNISHSKSKLNLSNFWPFVTLFFLPK